APRGDRGVWIKALATSGLLLPRSCDDLCNTDGICRRGGSWVESGFVVKPGGQQLCWDTRFGCGICDQWLILGRGTTRIAGTAIWCTDLLCFANFPVSSSISDVMCVIFCVLNWQSFHRFNPTI